MVVVPSRQGRWAGAAALAIVFAASSVPLAAQSLTEGFLRGEIVLASDIPVPEASITVEDASGVALRRLVSDRRGQFAVPQLAPGRYSVLVEKAGYQPLRQRGVSVIADATTHVRIRVARRPPPIASVEDVPIADQRFTPTAPFVAERLSRQALPWFGLRDDIADLGRNSVFATPPRDQRAGLTDNLGGLPQAQSRLLLDAMPMTWMRHPGVENDPASSPALSRSLFDPVQLAPHATDAEWVGGNAGTVSAISRRGGRTFRFEPFAFFSGGVGPTAAQNPSDSTTASFLAGATVSGVLIPNKADFIAGLSYQQLETPTARPWESDSGFFGGSAVPLAATIEAIATDTFGRSVARFTRPVVRREQGGSGGFRTDWHLSKSQQLVVRANGGHRQEEAPALGADLMNGAGTAVESNDFTTMAALLSSWSSTANEFRVGYRSAERTWDGAGLPASYLVGDGAAIGGSPASDGRFRRTALDFSETFHKVWGPASVNRIKVGIQYSLGKWEQNYLYGESGVFQFGDLASFGSGGQGAFFVSEAPRTATDFSIQDYGLFAEGLIRLYRGLSVLGGIRYDRQKFPSSKKDNPIALDPVFDSLFFGVKNNRLPDDNGNVAPRIGLVWDGGGNGAWTGSLGWSYHYGQLNPARVGEAAVASGPLIVRRGIGSFGAWPALPDTFAAPSAGKRIALFSPNGDYRNPRTSKVDFALARVLQSLLSVRVTAGYHHTDFLLRRSDLNRLPFETGTTQEGRPVYGTLAQEGGLVVAVPGSNRRVAGYDMVSGLVSTGYADHYQAGFAVTREAAQGLSFTVSYLWSRTRDNWLQSRTGDPADELSPFVQDKSPDGGNWSEGVSDFDVPHRAMLLGSYTTGSRIPLTVGLRYRFRSGLPFTPGFRPGVDPNADGAGGNDPAFVESSIPGMPQLINQNPCLDSQVGKFAERNSCREAANNALDLSLAAGIPVKSLGGRLEVMLDVFNLVATETGLVDRALVLVDPNGAVAADGLGNVSLPLIANPRFGRLLSQRTEPRVFRLGLRVAY